MRPAGFGAVFLALMLVAGCALLSEPEPVADHVQWISQLAAASRAAPPEMSGRDPFLPVQAPDPVSSGPRMIDDRGRDPFAATGFPAPNTSNGEGNGQFWGRDPFRAAPPEGIVVVPRPEPEPDPEPPVVPTGDLTLQVRTIDLCWLDVFVDGERVLRTNVPTGQVHSWTGGEIRLEQVGREPAIILSINGQEIGRLLELAERLERGPVTLRIGSEQVRVTLSRRYGSGVLVGLRFVVAE